MRALVQDFRLFIAQGNVVDLAVAVVIGAAFGAITTSLVEDVIMPPVGLLIGGVDFAELGVVLKDADRYASSAEAIRAGAPVLRYGAFLNTIINFLIIALAMFTVVRAVAAVQRLRHRETDTPEELPQEVALLQEIRDLLAAEQVAEQDTGQTRRPGS